MKRIGIIGSGMIGSLVSSALHYAITEPEQVQVKQEKHVRERISSLPASFDSSKCKKGHSYREVTVDMARGEMLVKPKWICHKCQREL